MSTDIGFAELLHTFVESLPQSWNPRRDQPEHDRMFNGRAQIEMEFGQQSNTARQWLIEALAFSATVQGGFAAHTDDGLGLRTFGAVARGWVAKGTNQGLGQ